VHAKGIIAGGVKRHDLREFMGRDIGVAITGEEKLGLTLIITEGFGRMAMSKRTFQLLKHFEGHMACMSGATQIRAGVLRPEVIIPHDGSSVSDEIKLSGGMVQGTSVRLIREPYFGSLGRVVRLPVDLKRIETQSLVRVVEVQLENGDLVTVPRANVEIMEE